MGGHAYAAAAAGWGVRSMRASTSAKNSSRVFDVKMGVIGTDRADVSDVSDVDRHLLRGLSLSVLSVLSVLVRLGLSSVLRLSCSGGEARSSIARRIRSCSSSV